ncbi:MAG TPA: PhoU domain-containing protein [Phycisphaerales bacterium]|nr:PhoU domain-containing protein [Phycisphaerales bacterium]
MPTTHEGFSQRLLRLKADLAAQGGRVQAMYEDACEAVFAGDEGAARSVIDRDDEIDRADVAIEKASVTLLADATNDGAALDAAQLRAVLTVVKVNNELERAADAAVVVAECVPAIRPFKDSIPQTFRVLTNSVVGILRDVNRAFERDDAALARLVLQSEDTVEAFKNGLLREAEERVAAGTMPVDLAFVLHELANQCERIADHATNIAEQVIYLASGAIVRHTDAGWVDLPDIARN